MLCNFNDNFFSSKTKRNNLLMYEKVTRENGPAMTWAMHVRLLNYYYYLQF